MGILPNSRELIIRKITHKSLLTISIFFIVNLKFFASELLNTPEELLYRTAYLLMSFACSI